jgi:hypothetical protein
MGWGVVLAAVSFAALVVMPASGNSLQRHVATCLRSAPVPGDCGSSQLEVEFSAAVTPHELPGRRFAPIEVTVGGTIGPESGGHPSALREATVAVGRGIRVDTEGLGSCARRRLERLNAAATRHVCRSAILGRGVARVGLASSDSVFSVPLVLFNGGTSTGVTRLFVHSSAEAAGGPVVAVAKIRHREEGLGATWRLPRILGGDGSLLGFRLEVKRGFAASGRRHSYLSARCPNGVFRVSAPKLTFVNETHAPGVPSQTVLKGGLAVPCAARR